MAIHLLKTNPEYFFKVVSGEKTFEVRSTHDRNFQTGDRLLLVLNNDYGEPSDQPQYWMSEPIKYILKGFPPYTGYCVMSLNGGSLIPERDIPFFGQIVPPGINQ